MNWKLDIICRGTLNEVRCSLEKWTFHDEFMGEQYVSFDIKSPKIIEWEVGDYCVFRGNVYTLNYIPSCKQTARLYESGDAFEYDGVKMNSYADELTRCIILDVVPTTGDYDQYAGTNYTGSAIFSLYCGETIWEGHRYAPVHALADRIKANLDRLYPTAGWQIKVNDEACGSEDYVINFNNWTATQALAEVHNTFECDYAIIGRTIYIGYSMPELTSTQDGPEGTPAPESTFYFGYGKGYPTAEGTDGTALFELKKVANPSQNIITRLRAFGSTKNMPYRYYMQKYTLPQTMFVHNLQLPDTFLPYSEASDPSGLYDRYKVDGNAERDATYGPGVLRHVLGETNDAYIDKNDDAASCDEGIREGVGAWDGSNPELEEIYPTISDMTYGDLRAGLIPDMLGVTGSEAYKSGGNANPYYLNNERIDELFGVDEDCNIGDGIIPLGDIESRTMTRDVEYTDPDSYTWVSGTTPQSRAFSDVDEILLAEFEGVLYGGDYTLSPTHQNVSLYGTMSYSGTNTGINKFRLYYQMRVTQVSDVSGEETEIARYISKYVESGLSYGTTAEDCAQVVALPDTASEIDEEQPQVERLHISEASTIRVYFKPIASIATPVTSSGSSFTFNYRVDRTDSSETCNLILSPIPNSSIADETFHIFLKELGFDLSQYSTVDDGAAQISMKTGNCVGRSFDIVSVEQRTDLESGKIGWLVELSRAVDDTIHVYYPNEQNILQDGDRFVLLNIELPEAYIKAAELRLLRAATEYLQDNCETKYTYEPSLNDIYVQQNYERCIEDGHPELSIFWRLYAGLKFPFRGIPESNDTQDPLPLMNITISQVEMTLGEKATPQVSIQLNDDLDQSTIQKLTISVDRMYNALMGKSASAAGMTSAFYELLKTEGAKMFLSKQYPDLANGLISFLRGIQIGNYAQDYQGGKFDENGNAEANSLVVRGQTEQRGNLIFGNVPFVPGATGGAIRQIDNDIHAEVDYLSVRKKMAVTEVEIQEVNYVGGNIVLSPADGFTITDVEWDDEDNLFYVYFESRDSDTGDVTVPQWNVGDLAFCEKFNMKDASGTDLIHRWWREVRNFGRITDESSPDYGKYVIWLRNDTGHCETVYNGISDWNMPMVGDKVVMLGHIQQSGESATEAKARQGAIILASAGGTTDAIALPYIRVYKDINTFSLAQATLVHQISYSGLVTNTQNWTLNVDLGDGSATIPVPFNNLYNEIDDVASQLDESFKVWHVDYDNTTPPSLSNLPASQWGGQGQDPYSEHVGDFCITSDGFCYEFKNIAGTDENVYGWVMVTDQYLIAYVTQIGEKKRVFVSQPTDASTYDIGDLWANAIYPAPNEPNAGSVYNRVMLVCMTPKVSGASFSIDHWTPADDTYRKLKNIDDDSVLSLTEKVMLEQTFQDIKSDYEDRVRLAEDYGFVGNTHDEIDGDDFDSILSYYKKIYSILSEAMNGHLTGDKYWLGITDDTEINTTNFVVHFTAFNNATSGTFNGQILNAATIDAIFNEYYHWKGVIDEAIGVVEVQDHNSIKIWETSSQDTGGASMNEFIGSEFDKIGTSRLGTPIWQPKQAAGFRLTPTSAAIQMYYKKANNDYRLAELAFEIDEDESTAKLAADNIKLEGYTTINGSFGVDLKGNMFALNGRFGGLVTHEQTIIHGGNKFDYGVFVYPEQGSSLHHYYVDISKCGQYVVLFEDTSNVPTGGIERYIGVDYILDELYCNIYINLPFVCDYYRQSGSTTTSTYNFLGTDASEPENGFVNGEWKVNSIETASYIASQEILKARSYVGCTITIQNLTRNTGVYIRGVESYGQSYYLLNSHSVSQQSQVTLTCVSRAGANGVEEIVWEAEAMSPRFVNLDNQGNVTRQYIGFEPTINDEIKQEWTYGASRGSVGVEGEEIIDNYRDHPYRPEGEIVEGESEE